PAAAQAQMGQLDPRPPRLEFTASGQHEVDARTGDALPIFARVGERGRATLDHLRRFARQKHGCPRYDVTNEFQYLGGQARAMQIRKLSAKRRDETENSTNLLINIKAVRRRAPTVPTLARVSRVSQAQRSTSIAR